MDKAWRKKQYGWGIIFLAAVIVLASLFGTSVVVCAISGLALMLGTLQATAFIVWQHIQSSDRCSFHLSNHSVLLLELYDNSKYTLCVRIAYLDQAAALIKLIYGGWVTFHLFYFMLFYKNRTKLQLVLSNHLVFYR